MKLLSFLKARTFVVIALIGWSGLNTQGQSYNFVNEMRLLQRDSICRNITLEANSTYRIKAFAKIKGDSVRAYIKVSTFNENKEKINCLKTNQATMNRWQQIDLLFTTPRLKTLAELQLKVAGRGQGWFDNLSFEKVTEQDWTLSDTIIYKGRSIPFRMWVAPGIKHVKGLILATKVRAEEEFVINPSIRKVAAEENLAIIKTDGKEFAMFDISKGEDNLFLRMIKKCADESGFSEIENAPWLTFGHSTAGHFAKNLAYWKPERTFGIIYFKSGQFYRPVWAASDATLKNVPILFVNGQFEEFGPHGPLLEGESNESQWNAVRDTIMLLRKSGHLASLILEPGEGHFCLSQKVADYLALFIKKAAQSRIPENNNQPLKTIPESSGVISDTCCSALINKSVENLRNVIHPYSTSKDMTKGFWHFDKEMAQAWIKFHEKNLTTK